MILVPTPTLKVIQRATNDAISTNEKSNCEGLKKSMVRFYLVTGVLLCALFVYAGLKSWKVIDPWAITGAKPTGPGSHYHK